jgi:hypothetical protein
MHFFNPRGPTGIIGDLRDLPENGEELPVAVREAVAAFIRNRDGALVEESGAFCTLGPIRPCWRGERRFLRTLLPGASLCPRLAFNSRPRRLSTPPLTPFNSTPTFARMDPRPSDALRASNDVLQREVDTIELLQTDLERARRDVTIARANVRVMNLGEKERGELRCVQGHKRVSPISRFVSTLDRVGPSLSTDR